MHRFVPLLAAAILAASPALAQTPVDTTFTYQGELRQSGAPVSAPTDLRFTLFDAPAGGLQVGPVLDRPAVPMSAGRFTVALDFGPVFTGDALWLEIAARPAGSGAHTILAPRQELTATPHAAFSLTAAAAGNAAALGGQSPGFYQNASNLTAGTVPNSRLSSLVARTDLAQTFTGATTFSNSSNSFAGSGAGLTSLSASNVSTGVLADARLSPNVSLLDLAQTFTAAKTFSNGALLLRNSAGTSSTTLTAPGSTAARTLALPDASGTVISTGNLSAITATGTVSTGVWQGSAVTPGFGGTGLTSYSAGDLLYASGSGALARRPIGAAGRYLRSDGAAPVWALLNPADLPSPLLITAIPGALALRASSDTAAGLHGRSTSASTTAPGVLGESAGPDAAGVRGLATNTGFSTALGVEGTSASYRGIGVRGEATHPDGSPTGVLGLSHSPGGTGVKGEVDATTGLNFGVFGKTGSGNGGIGVYGAASSTLSTGVIQGVGVMGYTNTGVAAMVSLVDGSTTTKSLWSLHNAPTGDTIGVHAEVASNTGIGVRGDITASSGLNYGVFGKTKASTQGIGVYGTASSTNSTSIIPGVGVMGHTNAGYAAVAAVATAGAQRAIYAANESASGTVYAIRAQVDSPSGIAISAVAGGTGTALRAESDANDAVVGITSVSGKSSVFGFTAAAGANGGYFNSAATTGAGRGVVGQSNSPSGYGLYSIGNTAATGTKSFQIDHPLDPANKYLNHYCAEGPEPMNIYSGIATLDSAGRAVVELPHYFESINRDPRYQLTCIGGFAPVYIASKVSGNRFTIAGGSPGLEVSWEIKAVRNDAWVRAHGAPVEPEKPAADRGRYLHPELHGRPASDALLNPAPAPAPHEPPAISAH